MKRSILLAILTIMSTLTTMAEITIPDLTSGKYSAKSVYGIDPWGDGDSYVRNVDGKRLVRYSFRDGKEQEVVFDVDNTKGRVRLNKFSGYIMSPKGDNILIETERKSIYRRSSTGVYYIYNIKNRTLVPLSDGGPQEQPLWSPDGYMVAFVRDGNLFLVKLLFNNAESQITKDGEFNKVINGKPDWVYEEEFCFARAFDFNADGTMLAWMRFDETEVPLYSFPLYKGMQPEMKEYLTYPGKYEYKYPMAGVANSKVSVHSFDIKSRVTRKIQVPVDADGYIPRLAFTNDPEKLLVLTTNRHQDRLDVWVANPRSTECRCIVRDEVKPYITENAWMGFQVLGNQFIIQSDRSGYAHYYLYDLTGTLRRTLTQGANSVTAFYGYDTTTGNVYYAAKDGSPMRSAVYVSDSKGKVRKISTKEGNNTAIFSKNYKYFLSTWSNIDTPPVYSLCDANGKELKVLEDNSALRQKLAAETLGTKEFFQFTTQQGVVLNGWMLKPANFDASKKYPVIMFQYSGPGSQQVLDSWSAGNMGGCMYEQYLAQEGFISVCVDGRGTGGRGAEFEKQTYLHLGQMESNDQVEAALWLGKQSYIDKNRIGIWGWSYGGFMTLMSMSEGRPVFAAGVAVAPPTCYRYYDTVYTERFMRTPQENEDGYNDNAITRAGKLHGKLLICQGTADDNVHYRNVAEYTEALVQADKDFMQLDFTNRNHFLTGGNTRNFLYRNITNWFKANL